MEDIKPLKVTKGKKQNKPKTVKPVKPKKEKILKPYFKIGEIPKGHRLASMQEAKDAKKIYYWGIKQVDKKLLQGKPPKEDLGKLINKIAGLSGKFNRLKKEIESSKNFEQKKKLQEEHTEEYKEISEKLNMEALNNAIASIKSIKELEEEQTNSPVVTNIAPKRIFADYMSLKEIEESQKNK